MFRYSNYPTLIEDIRHTLMERWRFLRKAGIQPEALTATPRACRRGDSNLPAHTGGGCGII